MIHGTRATSILETWAPAARRITMSPPARHASAIVSLGRSSTGTFNARTSAGAEAGVGRFLVASQNTSCRGIAILGCAILSASTTPLPRPALRMRRTWAGFNRRLSPRSNKRLNPACAIRTGPSLSATLRVASCWSAPPASRNTSFDEQQTTTRPAASADALGPQGVALQVQQLWRHPPLRRERSRSACVVNARLRHFRATSRSRALRFNGRGPSRLARATGWKVSTLPSFSNRARA